jgi:adenylyltransferase/sulfurtransferase
MGSIQANEVIKVITGVGEPLAGRLFQFDAAEFKTRIFKLTKDPDNPLTGTNPTQKGLIDYEYFCNLNNPASLRKKWQRTGDHRDTTQ